MDLLRRILHDVMAETAREAAPPTSTPRRSVNLGGPRRSPAIETDARALEREARAFLETLNPDSEEGLWFEAIAEGFPSRIHAAVAYVRDVKRARR